MNPAADLPRTVLITGASAGIGKALAHEFARHEFDVVLVARRGDKLQQLEAEIKQQYGQMAYPLVEDLADPDSPQRIHDWCRQQGLTVDALVNNAGYALHSDFVATEWNTHRDFIQVMMTSLVHLCHLFAPAMQDRGYGRIINLASIAAWSPQLKGNLYGAAKSFVLDFSQALDLELRPHGIHCTALCPGFTFSEFHDVMGTRGSVSKLPRFLWMTAEEVAREGFEAVMEGKPVHVTGRLNQGLSQVMAALPASLKHYLAKQQKLM
ncbi:MAG: SDR family oxidoreductase [Pseudomonadota bacterium]|nr:SDR family oxidoreductase [Pseudomonadota bacterium]